METHPRGRQLLAERDRVWAAVGKAQHVRDAELLRCTPNVTPFTQRVRTLHFLMALLAHGVASPLLRGAFALEDDAVARPKRARRGGGRPLGGTFVTPVPYALITTVEEAKTQLLPEFVRAGYEGAVVRTPMNVYEMREKRKGTVRALCRGLAAQSAASPRARGVPQEQHLRFTDASLAEALLEAQEAGAVAALAERRVRALAPRAYTAVKILPFLDQEFAVLRALFKEPSSNPRTRQLVTVSAASVGILAGDIKRENDTAEKKLKNKNRNPDEETDELVCFYGLQCLSDNGRVFNVTMPKLNTSQQKQLLDHILQSGGKRKKSLTGLYATVQFSSLTEHGVPRFGQVKAIRGGKGWFL
ncbi:DNA ligase (ATP) [Strigomonas culicis]|uniref:DNA ligase (ATP) n=1 Tax=Strigomonas culicis TaxID=28005 RepID=S9V591_9TRYP|nr:DNA ligase (ATP) [Strigomonas culicis]|eukprot:EPY36234.1 DNA ligase (ATP) [Strigomonas culicis]